MSACGGDDDGGSQSGGVPGGANVVQRFPNDALIPGAVRLPVSLAANNEVLKAGPSELRASIRSVDGREVASDLVAPMRVVADGLPVYWAFRAQIDAPGFYELVVKGAESSPAAFQLIDPAEVAIPSPGRQLPGFDTPTVDDPRGVSPICSRLEGVCPLHQTTLTQALESGKPVLYMIGTPAHCATGVCAPGLEYVIAAHERVGDAVAMVHADVFADDAATTYAPAVRAYELTYEPVVFLADPAGRVVERVDVVWDQSEIDEAVDRLLAVS